MKAAPIALALVTGVALAAPARADVRGEIKAACAAEWPGDYRMQEYCVEKQIEAARDIVNLQRRYGEDSEEAGLLYRCMAEWRRDDRTYDYRMARYCADKQIGSYHRLK